MKNFKDLFLTLLFSLSFSLVSIAQDERPRSNSLSGTNTITTDELTTLTTLGDTPPEMVGSSDPNPTDDLPIDSHLVVLLFAGLLFAFYKFQIGKSKVNSNS